MKRPGMDGLSEEQLKYVEYLECRGIPKLQLALSNLCNLLADEVNMVVKGEDAILKILNGDEKVFERFLAIVKNKKDFDALTVVGTEETTTIKKTRKNIQDYAINK